MLVASSAPGTESESDLHATLAASGCEIVAESHDGLEILRLTAAFEPQIAVLDLDVPFLGGLSAARLVLRISPRTRLIALGSSSDRASIDAAHDAGFNGFVERSRTHECLLDAIESVLDGVFYSRPSRASP